MEKKIIEEIKSFSNEQKAKVHSSFFKTAKGEYGEGDLFFGVNSPTLRAIAKKYYKLIELSSIQKMLEHPYHEVRLEAVFLMVLKFQKGNTSEKKEIFDLYMKNLQHINNWDLVDLSAPYIVGAYIFDDDTILKKLSQSGQLWSERISIVATLYFIKKNKYDSTLFLAKHFLSHSHDLIHKATGWMLREVGKKDEKILCDFLDENIKNMPRTMLRYAIEKFEEPKRKSYLLK